MTDLLRLATELERSGGMHRFIALVQAASLVLLRFEHGESGVGMSAATGEPSVGAFAASIAAAKLKPLRDAVRRGSK